MSDVVFTDENGEPMKPWMVRAGMLVTDTDYNATTGALMLCVLSDSGGGPLASAMEYLERDHARRMEILGGG